MKITKTKQEKGITLVALIITIVVLLILAVVAINSITNDGLISKAEEAANKYNESVQNEADQLQNYLNYLNEHIGGSGNGDGDETKTYTPYTVGQEVRLTEAQRTETGETGTFYVVKDSGTTESKVTIVTKLGINTDDMENIVQSSSPTSMKFSGGIYTCENKLENAQLRYTLGAEEPDSVFYAACVAYEYGAQIGGLGRLPDDKELLNSKCWDLVEGLIMCWVNSAHLNFSYDATQYGGGYEYLVFGEFCQYMWAADMGTDRPALQVLEVAKTDERLEVRPVVEISKDLIELVTAE